MTSTLQSGSNLTNSQICEIFGCSPQGGMRRALRTNSLVLVSSHVDSIYHDRWIGDVLHYTGTGQRGNQRLDATQNKTLADSHTNGVNVHLLEEHTKGVYTYVGCVQLAGEPYSESQPDAEDLIRSVWVFPLTLIDGAIPAVPSAVLDQQAARVARKVHRLSDDEVRSRAARARPSPGQRPTTTKRFDRDPHVAEYAKRRAKGRCELCRSPAPFNNGNGEPYLETHHIVWLANGGDDTIANTVALCPNCHRRMHVLNLPADQAKLKSLLGDTRVSVG
jgi:5-methylcytosine-specific restriction protein A